MVSETLLDEVRGVLMRTKFRKYLAEDDVARYIRRLRRAATLADEGGEIPRYTEDREDDYLVALPEELPLKAMTPEDFMAKLRAMD